MRKEKKPNQNQKNEDHDFYIGEGFDIEKLEEVVVKEELRNNKYYVIQSKISAESEEKIKELEKINPATYKSESGVFDMELDSQDGLEDEKDNLLSSEGIKISQSELEKPSPIVKTNSDDAVGSLKKTDSKESEDDICRVN